MEQYTLNVSGINGALAATVKLGEEVIETFPVRDIKDAQKSARSVALKHRNENRPAKLTQFTEHFSV